MGTRARGKGFPSGFSASDDLEKQREQDIPISRHTLIDDEQPVGEGVNDGTFFDSDSPLSTENMIAEELFNTKPTNAPPPFPPQNTHSGLPPGRSGNWLVQMNLT